MTFSCSGQSQLFLAFLLRTVGFKALKFDKQVFLAQELTLSKVFYGNNLTSMKFTNFSI